MKRLLVTIISIVIGFVGAYAQSVTFESSAPLSVGAGERFRVEFTLKNESGSNFIAPEFTGLRVLAGPSVSTGREISYVNGQMTQSSSETYTYFVEAMADSSRGSVSAARITAGSNEYSTKPMVISILAGEGGGRGGNGSSGGGGTGGGSGTSRPVEQQEREDAGVQKEDILLRFEVSKRSVYQGEGITAQLKLYTRVGIASINDVKYPSLSGFWTQELDRGAQQATRSTIGGVVYEGHVLREWLLYPQRSGTIQIESASLEVMAQIISRGGGGMSLFDQFFGGGSTVSTVERKVTAPRVSINVKALPDGAPLGLPIAVGDFTMSVIPPDSTISANSASSLTVTINGTGDFPLFTSPAFSLPAEFEQYDTKTTDKTRSTSNGMAGSISWEYPFIARSEGRYTIPKVEFAYFNPKTKRYSTLSTPEYTISVSRDTKSADGGAVISGVNREDLKILGSDIRYIITTAPPKGNSNTTAGLLLYSILFVMTLIIIIALGVIAIVVIRVRNKGRADIVGTKTRKASKVAIRRLKSAKKQLDAGNKGQFFEEILQALWGFIGDRYVISTAELTKERIKVEFESRGVVEQLSAEFISVVEECEMASYAPSAAMDMQRVYERSFELLSNL